MNINLLIRNAITDRQMANHFVLDIQVDLIVKNVRAALVDSTVIEPVLHTSAILWTPSNCVSNDASHFQKVEDETQLLCYKKYLNISDEYIRLEEVMLKPRLVLVHDVFTRRETDLMIREATAEVSRQNLGQGETERHREGRRVMKTEEEGEVEREL